MHIYVDADACPVIRIVENIAKKYNIETTLICDTNHVLTSDYSDVVTVSAGADAVDFKLVNLCTRDDIVVTQDYGVAAMALSKGEFNSVAQVNGGLENMINWEGKDKDTLALIKYTADEDKLEKVLENPQVIKTPVVRNGRASTLGYQPDIWKGWE